MMSKATVGLAGALVLALSACTTGPTRAPGAASAATAATPLPMAQCLDPERARGWTLLANDELLVDTGRLRYHVRLSMACPELGTTPALQFRPGGGIGRVCGHPTDAVLPQGRDRDPRPCPIASLRVVDAQEYEALAARRLIGSQE